MVSHSVVPLNSGRLRAKIPWKRAPPMFLTPDRVGTAVNWGAAGLPTSRRALWHSTLLCCDSWGHGARWVEQNAGCTGKEHLFLKGPTGT